MRKILVPPVLTLLCIAGIIAGKYVGEPVFWHEGGLDPLGYLLIIAGTLIPIWGAQSFKRHQTNILPYKDPDHMVSDGPFKFTRNPMYLGMLMVILGAEVLVGTWIGLIFPPLFFVVANWWYIPFEESRMAAVFGEKFDDYKSSVRRWL